MADGHDTQKPSSARTETLNTQQRLRLFEVAAELANVGHWHLNMLTNAVWWSDEIYRIHGYEPGNFAPDLTIGVNSYHPDDQETVSKALEHSQKTGEDFTFSLRIIRPTGEIRYVRSHGICEKNDAGDTIGMFGVFLDETEARRRQNILQEDRMRFELAVQAGGFGVWDLTLDSDKLVWDARMFEIYGKEPRPELRYEDWEHQVHPDDKAAAATEFSTALASRKAFDTRFRIIRPDGSIRHIQANGAALFNAVTGEAERAIGINYDITDIAELQAATLKAKEEQEAANRMKSVFIANMSHEIRTPMNGILMSLDLALGQVQDDEQRSVLEVAQRSSRSLLSLINDILDVSKIESGKLEIRISPFAIKPLIDQVISLHKPAADDKGLALSATLAPDLPNWLNGDQDRLLQVINNLISNAIKFTDHGSVDLSVDVEQCEHKAALLCVSVRDTGQGIKAKDRDRLFRRFSQLDRNTDSHQIMGTGLGLSISKQLVTLMGGEIDVESDGQAGSHFWFKTPTTVAESPSSDGAYSPPTDGAKADDTGVKSLNILIAEDIPINQMLFAKMLRKFGHEVEIANDGVEALAALNRDGAAIDLVLMDNRMPNMGGIEATQAIRALTGPIAAIPIIAITADALDEQRHAFMDAGADGFISKPVREEHLRATIDDIVRAK